MEKPYAELADEVREALRDHDYRQQDLAALADISQGSVSKLLSGYRVGADIIMKVARAVDRNPADWLEIARRCDERMREAKSRDPRIHEINKAYIMVKADRDYPFGNRTVTAEPDATTKYGIIRLYERATGKRLLPAGFRWP